MLDNALAVSGSCVDPVYIAAFGNAVLEIIPLRLCIGPSSAARPLRPVGLDRQRATLLRKLRADWTGGLRAIRRRGFSHHGGGGEERRYPLVCCLQGPPQPTTPTRPPLPHG